MLVAHFRTSVGRLYRLTGSTTRPKPRGAYQRCSKYSRFDDKRLYSPSPAQFRAGLRPFVKSGYVQRPVGQPSPLTTLIVHTFFPYHVLSSTLRNICCSLHDREVIPAGCPLLFSVLRWANGSRNPSILCFVFTLLHDRYQS